MVGQALASRLAGLGHEVMMGSRTAGNANARAWQQRAGANTRIGTFQDAARFGEAILNCTQGSVSLDALRLAGPADLAGKVLIDVANPLDFSHGMPPLLTICNTDSLGESIQREFPRAKVVKALNTCNCEVMVDPARVPGEHDISPLRQRPAAKESVAALLRELGWRSIIDLGDITGAPRHGTDPSDLAPALRPLRNAGLQFPHRALTRY